LVVGGVTLALGPAAALAISYNRDRDHHDPEDRPPHPRLR
jgi:hypothetical protein